MGVHVAQEYPELQKQANWNVDTTPESIEWDDLIAEALERGKEVPEVTWRQPGEDGAREVRFDDCNALRTISAQPRSGFRFDPASTLSGWGNKIAHCSSRQQTREHRSLRGEASWSQARHQLVPKAVGFAASTTAEGIIAAHAPAAYNCLLPAAAGVDGREGGLPDKGAAGALRLQAQRPQCRRGVGPERLLPLWAAGAAAGGAGGWQAPQHQQGALLHAYCTAARLFTLGVSSAGIKHCKTSKVIPA